MCYTKSTFLYNTTAPSVNKGRHGFDGQKYAHTAMPLDNTASILFESFLVCPHLELRQNCLAPVSDEFSSDFCFLRCRRAGARQSEKGKKRRKGTLSGVFALVNRWQFPYIKIIGISVFVNSRNSPQTVRKGRLFHFCVFRAEVFAFCAKLSEKIIDF